MLTRNKKLWLDHVIQFLTPYGFLRDRLLPMTSCLAFEKRTQPTHSILILKMSARWYNKMAFGTSNAVSCL